MSRNKCMTVLCFFVLNWWGTIGNLVKAFECCAAGQKEEMHSQPPLKKKTGREQAVTSSTESKTESIPIDLHVKMSYSRAEINLSAACYKTSLLSADDNFLYNSPVYILVLYKVRRSESVAAMSESMLHTHTSPLFGWGVRHNLYYGRHPRSQRSVFMSSLWGTHIKQWCHWSSLSLFSPVFRPVFKSCKSWLDKTLSWLSPAFM